MSAGDFIKHELLQVNAIRNSWVEKELFVDYSEKVMIWRVNSTPLFEESGMKSEKRKYNGDQERRCNDVEYFVM